MLPKNNNKQILRNNIFLLSVSFHVFFLVQCHKDYWMCATENKCILKELKCNAERDCSDHSDELNCTFASCSRPGINGFLCQNKECINYNYRCDNSNRQDCEDLSDEKFCDICWDFEFRCITRDSIYGFACISATNRCDGYHQCEDGSDEQNCDTCYPGREFKCTSGKNKWDYGPCIPISWKCDNKRDCYGNDDSDERGCQSELKLPRQYHERFASLQIIYMHS